MRNHSRRPAWPAAGRPRCSRRSRAATRPWSRCRTRSMKKRLPWTSWRASASPPGRLPSASTHMPPTGAHWPSATAFLMRSKTSRVVVPASTRTAAPASRRRRTPRTPRPARSRWRRCGTTCAWSRGSATARRCRCGRDRRPRWCGRWRARARAARPQQLPRGRPRGAGDVVQVERVQRAVQRVQDLVAARVVLAELEHQLAQHLHVEREVPDVLVQYGEVGAREGVERLAPGGGLVAERGRPRKPSARMSGLEAASTR